MGAGDAWSYGFGELGNFGARPHAAAIVEGRIVRCGREGLGHHCCACGGARSTACCSKAKRCTQKSDGEGLKAS